VPALAYLQFPWRLLMVVTVACGAIGAYALSLVPSRGAQAAIVLAAVAGQLALVHHYARPKAYIPQAPMDIDRSGWKYDTIRIRGGLRRAGLLSGQGQDAATARDQRMAGDFRERVGDGRSRHGRSRRPDR
jgi:hypothetical protein